MSLGPQGDNSANRRAAHVQSVNRAVDLLRAVAAAPGFGATVPYLAESCGLNRSTAWRLLVTLEDQGLVVRDRHRGSFSIGMGVVHLARTVGVDKIVLSAHPVVERLSLQTGETVALALVDELGLTYVDEVMAPTSLDESWLGASAGPLHATSCGKALLAFCDPDSVPLTVGPQLERFTATTVTDMTELLAELIQVRRDGFAVCRGELSEDSWGVSAPILGAAHQPVAVLSMWGPAGRGGHARFEALGSLAREAARALSSS